MMHLLDHFKTVVSISRAKPHLGGCKEEAGQGGDGVEGCDATWGLNKGGEGVGGGSEGGNGGCFERERPPYFGKGGEGGRSGGSNGHIQESGCLQNWPATCTVSRVARRSILGGLGVHPSLTADLPTPPSTCNLHYGTTASAHQVYALPARLTVAARLSQRTFPTGSLWQPDLTDKACLSLIFRPSACGNPTDCWQLPRQADSRCWSV